MQLFYCPEILNNQFFLSEIESRHATKVLRKKTGNTINVIDGHGNLYVVEITDAQHKKCCFKIQKTTKNYKPLPYQLHIAIAPTKNIDRFEWFLEKITEIGVSEITPILCKHSERKTIKPERLNKVLISAMKQSQQAFLPTLNPLASFNNFVNTNRTKQKFIAHCENSEKKPLKELYTPQPTVILIGPEGDFSPDEITLAHSNDFKNISLGNNRLRTETAGVVVCSTINILSF